MLHLDTSHLPRADRAEAFHAALSSANVPAQVSHDGPALEIRARLQLWQLGPGADLFHNSSSGYRLVRAPRHLRVAAPERVSLALHLRGSGEVVHNGERWDGTPTELRVLDLTSPYEYTTRGTSVAQSFTVDYDQLRLPARTVQSAIAGLAASPLHDLVHRHLVDLPRAAAHVEGTPAAAILGDATVQLVRALIVTASQDERLAGDALAESLFVRLTTYVRQHLAEADLSPARVAAVHNISVRHLHAVFAAHDTTLGRYVLHERLQGARRDLHRPGNPDPLIASIARRWGFADPGHFARRFRAAYGMSPRDWQRLAHEGAAPRTPEHV